MIKTDIVIAGCGVAGLFCALNLPKDKNIIILSKSAAEESDSFLAQGGICVQYDDTDFEPFFEDTLKAGHYENNKEAVRIMIRDSREIIDDLLGCGVEFERNRQGYIYTKEGAHSRPRILFRADKTGKEITSKLLARVRALPNVTLLEHHTAVDILRKEESCAGLVCHDSRGNFFSVEADYTLLATGGIGGLFAHSTNFPHLTGDGLAIAIRHGIRVKDIDYIQIHPTTLYTKSSGREFLISESVRGEGAILLNAKGERFVDELQPRDVVANAIYRQMEEDKADHVWLSMAPIPEKEINSHFPNIYSRCLSEGYDPTKENIPVVPAQHYFMGGIEVNTHSKTSMDRLYAIGETACNGVHGRNRLASNSLLESLVFAKRAAKNITENYSPIAKTEARKISPELYENYQIRYKDLILEEIEKEKQRYE